MNAREAYRALLEGKKARHVHCTLDEHVSMDEAGVLRFPDGELAGPLSEGTFELFEEPATDEELVAEMERRAQGRASHVVAVYKECANMLRTRKVKP